MGTRSRAVKYLKHHRAAGRLIFRRAIPARLRPYVPGGLREIVRTIKAADIHAPGALDRYKEALGEYEHVVAQAKKEAAGAFDALDAPAIAYLAESFKVHLLDSDQQARWDQSERQQFAAIDASLQGDPSVVSHYRGQEGQRWALKKLETLDTMEPIYRSLQATGDLPGLVSLWGDEALMFAEAMGYRLDPASAPFGQLCVALNRASIAAFTDMRRRLDGEDIATPSEPASPIAQPSPQATTAPEGSGETFRTIALQVMDDPRLTSVSTRETLATALRFFTESVGDLRPQDITRRSVDQWVGELGRRPARPNARERLLPFPELIRLFEGQDVKRMSGKTQRNLVRVLATLWRTAQRAGFIPEKLDNPFANHTIREDPQPELPQQLSDQELQAIFNLPIFTAGERPSGCKGEACYWVPLLLLWTGARPEEVAQLIVSDVTQDPETGRWRIRYTDEGAHPRKGARTLKTARRGTGRRTIPIPQKLIDLGFLRYVKSLRDQGEEALFPKLTPRGKRRELSRDFGEFWNRHLRAQGVLPADPSRRGQREFRQNFGTEWRRAQVSEAAAHFIMGHSVANDVSSRYGSRETYGRQIDKITYPQLDLSKVIRWSPATP